MEINKPTEEDTSISLPLTFDYSTGKSGDKKTNIIIGLVLFLVLVFSTAIVVLSTMNLFLKIGVIAIVYVAVSFVLRFYFFHERTYREAYERLLEKDNIPNTDCFWNIYEVEDLYPHICRFRGSKSGVFVLMEKDVVVGKGANVSYNHYEAISEAYNMGLNMCQIDFMDNVGNDSRLEGLYSSLKECDNEDLRDVLFDMYSNLESEMSLNYASYDVYLFTSKKSDDNLWSNVKSVISLLMQGNYLSYKVLNLEGIRSVCMALYNLEDFSAKNACDSLLSGGLGRGIVPITISDETGEHKLNKTREELRLEEEQRQRMKKGL